MSEIINQLDTYLIKWCWRTLQASVRLSWQTLRPATVGVCVAASFLTSVHHVDYF